MRKEVSSIIKFCDLLDDSYRWILEVNVMGNCFQCTCNMTIRLCRACLNVSLREINFGQINCFY